MKTMKVKLTFVEPVLGTSPANEDIYREFIASKAPVDERINIEDEVAALGVDEVVEKGMTIFPKLDDGTPFVYDYQLKGFFKGAASALRQIPGSRSSKVKAYKKKVDQLIFVTPRQIPVLLSGPADTCQRPLRASTPQGERVSLAMSEEIPAGSVLEFSVVMLNDDDEKLVREWLNYGVLHGFGQWRNSGKGRFTWECLGVENVDLTDADNVMAFGVA